MQRMPDIIRIARYYFFHSEYVELLSSKASETLEVDIGLESVKRALRESQKERWNSFDLHSMYS